MVSVGDDEREYCKTSRVSLDKLSQSHIGDTGETGMIEQILELLWIKHITTIGLSQQCAFQQSLPKVILQSFWNIGSDFGTFFEAKYLYNPIV